MGSMSSISRSTRHRAQNRTLNVRAFRNARTSLKFPVILKNTAFNNAICMPRDGPGRNSPQGTPRKTPNGKYGVWRSPMPSNRAGSPSYSVTRMGLRGFWPRLSFSFLPYGGDYLDLYVSPHPPYRNMSEYLNRRTAFRKFAVLSGADHLAK